MSNPKKETPRDNMVKNVDKKAKATMMMVAFLFSAFAIAAFWMVKKIGFRKDRPS